MERSPIVIEMVEDTIGERIRYQLVDATNVGTDFIGHSNPLATINQRGRDIKSIVDRWGSGTTKRCGA